MPKKIRAIKPDLLDNPHFARLSLPARYLYRTLPCFMDIQGLARGEPRLIKNQVFGYDDAVLPLHVSAIMAELCHAGFWQALRDSSGSLYVRDVHFDREQFPNPKRERMAFPAPETLEVVPPDVLEFMTQQPALHSFGSAEQMRIGIGIGNGSGRGCRGGIEEMSAVPDSRPEPAPSARRKRAAVSPPVGAIPEFEAQSEYLAQTRQSVQVAWLEAYPDADWVLREIAKAKAWALSRGKTHRNVGRFVSNWLGNADNPPAKPAKEVEAVWFR